MRKGIKRRKYKNIVLKTITAAMVLLQIVSFLLFAFTKPLEAYAILFGLGALWCVLFFYANGGESID